MGGSIEIGPNRKIGLMGLMTFAHAFFFFKGVTRKITKFKDWF